MTVWPVKSLHAHHSALSRQKNDGIVKVNKLFDVYLLIL